MGKEKAQSAVNENESEALLFLGVILSNPKLVSLELSAMKMSDQ